MSNPIQTALLSYGMSGLVFHAPHLAAHSGFSIRKILKRKSGEPIARYPETEIVQSMDAILNDPAIELVFVNTPNETHFDFATKALEAGKHVVVEKPVTVTADEAEKLIALAKKKNKLLTVFQNRRWDGDFLTIKKVLDEKLLGKVVEYEAHYDRYRNYVEKNTWKEEAGPGVSILYNLGSHMIDQVLVLFGMPNSVDARMGIQRPGGKVDDFYDIRMEYADHLVILKSSYLVREAGPRYTIHGVNGSFVKYGLDTQEQALKEGKIPGSPNWGTEDKKFWGKLNTEFQSKHREEIIESLPGNYSLFYENLHDAIRNNKPLAVKPEESMQGLIVIEAAIESNKTKRAVAVK